MEKLFTKISAVILSVLLLMSAMPMAFASTVVASGTDAGLEWNLDNDGVLSVAGAGSMSDNAQGSDTGWYALREQVKSIVIGGSVTYIGELAFYECVNLESVSLGEKVTAIGEGAFYGCTSLKSVKIPSGVSAIGKKAFGYYYDDSTDKTVVVDGFNIDGAEGSAAESYAEENGLSFNGQMPQKYRFIGKFVQRVMEFFRQLFERITSVFAK